MNNQSELMTKIDGAIAKKESLIDSQFFKYAVRSVLATLYLSLGSAVALYLGIKVDGPAGKALYAAAFGVGLVLIIFLSAELGTSNMMYMSVGVYRKKIKFSKAFKILMTCVLFNLVGAFVVAYLLSLTGAFHGIGADNFLTHLVEGKFQKSAVQTVVEGMFANIIVNLAVLMSMKVKDDLGRIFSIIMVLFIFTFLGYEHVIANFVYFPLAYFSSGGAIVGMTVGALTQNIILTFLGNFIGGGLVVGLTYAWLNNNESLKYLD